MAPWIAFFASALRRRNESRGSPAALRAGLAASAARTTASGCRVLLPIKMARKGLGPLRQTRPAGVFGRASACQNRFLTSWWTGKQAPRHGYLLRKLPESCGVPAATSCHEASFHGQILPWSRLRLLPAMNNARGFRPLALSRFLFDSLTPCRSHRQGVFLCDLRAGSSGRRHLW